MAPLRFLSTNGETPPVDLREALIRGQAPDRGLYLPERFPRIDPEELAEFAQLPYAEIAFRVLSRYTEGLIEPEHLRALCQAAYDYPVPLEAVTGRVRVLRLDHGPTASFKDFAARMMARWMGYFLEREGRQLTILTATSGDTGSAVAAAFHRVPGVRVVVLFPRWEVSDRQRKQMTTLGDNIRTVALEGKFDDCQALVKRAFADPELAHLNLSSANSINIGRLLPQSVYYFYAASRVAAPGEPVIFSVPSGNFGNMMGAVIAGRMGLPLRRLLVPVNANDAFPRFLASGIYRKVEPSRACLSNAMNVGHPSNLARLVAVYGGHLDEQGHLHRSPDLEAMRRDLFSVSVSDAETCATIRQAWEEHRLLLEPHGAVAWRGWLTFQAAAAVNDLPVLVLETAHPAKFPEPIERTLGFAPEAPPSLRRLDELPARYEVLAADYGRFREYLRDHFDGDVSN